MEFSVLESRKKRHYRFLEAFLGTCTIGFIFLIITTSFLFPVHTSVFLIVFSFMWLLRTSMIMIYTIYGYKNISRWNQLEWPSFVKQLTQNYEQGKKSLEKWREKYKGALDWEIKVETDLDEYEKIQGTKFAQIDKIYHAPVFAVYNESAEVLIPSLKSIYNSGYDLSKIVVFISQEARVGEEFNQKIYESISQEKWVNTYNISERNLEKVYSEEHERLIYSSKIFKEVKLSKNRLNIVFTQHPDGLKGEIKGKASNEDWGGRQISLFTKSKKIDPELILVTSLDADSRVGRDFFYKLSYKFCVTSDRFNAGFQPMPIYSNNYFQSISISRLVATQTTLYQFCKSSLDGENEFFANYSLPLITLQKVNFWVRDVIAEDYLLYAKCLIHFQGKFRVVNFYGQFMGDAVEAEDYLGTVNNQYKQLQRWSWGGVESFPYLFTHFFLDENKHKIPLKLRLKVLGLLFTNHFFWATSPITFSIIMILPTFFGGHQFLEEPISVNLWLFSQYFAWISFLFLIIYGFITFNFVAKSALNDRKITGYAALLIILQWIISPFVYGLMGFPALDSQFRGVRGKYLGYWVTPKK